MAKEEHYHTQFEYGRFYHVYNRSIDLKPMFKSGDNYRFFLKRYNDFLSEVVDTLAYNLLGNHFHFCIKIKPKELIDKFIQENPVYEKNEVHYIVSAQFKRLFQSYALAFNKQQQRIGTLFQKPFKRALIDDPQYLQNTIIYIHQNAQLHGLVTDFRDWEWSSYSNILSNKVTQLKRQETIGHFGLIENFTIQHKMRINDWNFEQIEM